MRLLLWVFLATLVTLFGNVASASSAIANTDSTHHIKLVDNAVAEVHNNKRSLRSSNQIADDEERAYKIPASLDDLVAKAKTSLVNGKTKLYAYLSKYYARFSKWWNNRNTKPTASGLPQPQVPAGARPPANDGLPVPVPPPGLGNA
ncbi:hypothetical protein PHMEG_00025056 [Phytophthora megakarya]|uniref:RxLR effector protein n=1 Tax=Phytophthora megakarya TaxID=4795 RepID=A0A225VFH7_9STRA|nr:hypothetical protein PHMEG_00025056 [Phytophthora megakarya]